jgi:hypothetical protein
MSNMSLFQESLDWPSDAHQLVRIAMARRAAADKLVEQANEMYAEASQMERCARALGEHANRNLPTSEKRGNDAS